MAIAQWQDLLDLGWAQASAETGFTSENQCAAVLRGRELGKVYQEVMGKNYPAMTLVQVADLVEDRALVEIEVTAVKP